MSKLYGSLVGTPLSTLTLGPRPVPIKSGLSRATDHVIVRDTILLAAAAVATVISLGFCGWDSIVDPDVSTLHNDALGAGVTLAIGDVSFPAALAAATVCTAAGSFSMMKTITIGNYFQPIWQQLGYATRAAAILIGPQAEILATIGVGAATGNVTWQLKGQSR